METADILLVADNSDLNVYKTADKDGKQVGCCGPASQGKSSCSGSNTSTTNGLPEDIDLNEWAGKVSSYLEVTALIRLTFLQARSRYTLSNHRIRTTDLG